MDQNRSNTALADLEEQVLLVATELAARGPAWAQEAAVTRELYERFPRLRDLEGQQQLLTCWHNLFRKGRLSWGYDLDNPNMPFYHVPARADQDGITSGPPVAASANT